MANRRMFSRDIVRSDAFLDLSLSAQALYFHLGMEADDRGYVSNAKSIIRCLGANVGDLEQLATKKFILIRGENLILIKGWRINNYIQNDRMSETRFVDDLKRLYFDSNNSYTEQVTERPCIQSGYNLDTQDSIGKDSIGKYSINKRSFCSNLNSIEHVEDETSDVYLNRLKLFWNHYPKKQGKGNCEKWFKRNKPSTDLLDKMIIAIEKQKHSKQWQRDNGQYIPMPFTWLNQKRWEDELETSIEEDSPYANLE